MSFLHAVALTSLGFLAYFVVAMAVSLGVLHVKERCEDREFDRRVEQCRERLDREVAGDA